MNDEKIYVNFPVPDTIGEFLKAFYSITGWRIDETNGRLPLGTYHDEQCSELQCSEGLYRSFDDLMLVVNTYFPNTGPEKLIHELIVADIHTNAGRPLYPYFMVCDDICKIVFMYNVHYNENPPWGREQYNSQWSWGELLLMIGLSDQRELEEYVNRHRGIDQPAPVLSNALG